MIHSCPERTTSMATTLKGNAVAHFEIYGDDPEKLSDFYKSLFNWTIEPYPGMDYRVIKTVETDARGAATQPGGINGGMMKRPAPELRGWLNYVNVASVDEWAQKAQKLGARLMKPKSAVPSMGWFAILVDPQGNPFALWQTDHEAK
jgi:predicted enzyme related to lactoylglutathione lyase